MQVDVGNKPVTRREATASCLVLLPPETLSALGCSVDSPFEQRDTKHLTSKKGPIISTATIAGIMAAKRTSELLPFCHPLPIEWVGVNIAWFSATILKVSCSVRVSHTTGVEMEAMAGASGAALCIIDMLKASSHDISITQLRLERKSGGKRFFERARDETETSAESATPIQT